MTTIITYGTFDLFHLGHLNILRRARALGSRLVVGVSDDAFNEVKGKRCTYPYADRAEIVAAIRYVDHVFPESSWDQKRRDITDQRADVFVMGDDWRGRFDDLSDICEVHNLARTPDISTTSIKRGLASSDEGAG